MKWMAAAWLGLGLGDDDSGRVGLTYALPQANTVRGIKTFDLVLKQGQQVKIWNR
jgi:hypothetical protein